VRFSVEISPAVAAQAFAAYEDLTNRSPDFAEKWYDGLLVAIRALEHMPRRHPHAREQDVVNFELRQFSHRPYRVLFTVSGPTVRLLYVRHLAMDDIPARELGR
jgi:hypothetical protein